MVHRGLGKVSRKKGRIPQESGLLWFVISDIKLHLTEIRT